MSRKCQLSNKKGLVGNKVSHSNRRTKMRQEPNLQTKAFWLAEKKKWIKLRVSTRMIRTIAKNGLVPTLKKYGLQKLYL